VKCIFFSFRFHYKYLPTALAGILKQSVASVRPSVHLSVRLFPLHRVNRLTIKLEFLLCVGHEHSLPGIESQGHISRSKVKGQRPARMGVLTQ